jgi:hypothetical protein
MCLGKILALQCGKLALLLIKCINLISDDLYSPTNLCKQWRSQPDDSVPLYRHVYKLSTQSIDLTDYSLLPNGLVFMSNTYLCFVLSRVENYFVIEPKNSKKQIRPGKHGNIIFIFP